MQKTIDVAIGIVVEFHGRSPCVLIARRPEQSVLAGYWEFPGGKLEPGETAAQCLVREFQEELGVTIRPGDALRVIEHEYDHGCVRLHPYYCVRRAGTVQDLQVAEHRWVPLSQLDGYLFPSANEALINWLAKQWKRDAGELVLPGA